MFHLIIISIFIAVLAFILYRSSKRKQSYWEKQGVRCAQTFPVLGSILDTYVRPRHEVEMTRYNELGRIYGYYEGSIPCITVADPNLLKKILIKDHHIFNGPKIQATGNKVVDNMVALLQGDKWKCVRSIMSPIFSSGKIRRMTGLFQNTSERLIDNFRTSSEGGRPIDLKSLYGAFTMDVILNSAFSINVQCYKENQFLKYARMIFNEVLTWKLMLFQLSPWLVRTLRVKLTPREATDFFKDFILDLIKERRATKTVRNDFLQLLMDSTMETDEGTANDTAANHSENEVEKKVCKTTIPKKLLSMDELVSQCTVFFLSGYETTASTLSFVTYMLALHEDVQDRLREEVNETLEQNNGILTSEVVQEMRYIEAVISETLRLFPPAFKLERRALEEYTLKGDFDIIIPKGAIVNVPTCAIHRDPEFFPDPERFDPDRFTPEMSASRNQFNFVPFGGGPRKCIGQRFALLEIKVCLAYVISSFTISRCQETQVPLRFDLGQHGLLQSKNIKVRMEPREDSPLQLRAHE